MNKSKLRMLMLTVIATAPLAAAPAFASGGSGGSFWQQLIQWLQGGSGSSGNGGSNGGGSTGGGTSLPGPGALGLVVLGLGTGIIVARRRK